MTIIGPYSHNLLHYVLLFPTPTSCFLDDLHSLRWSSNSTCCNYRYSAACGKVYSLIWSFFCPEKSVHLQHVHLHTHTGVSFWAYLQSYTVAPLAVCGGLALPVFVAYVKGMRTSAKLRWRRTLDRYPASLNPDGFAGHLICTMLWLKD